MVKPLHKKGDKTCRTKHRLISPLTGFSKTLKKGMQERLIQHLHVSNWSQKNFSSGKAYWKCCLPADRQSIQIF